MTTATIASHELARLIENDRLLQYVLANVTYLEDGKDLDHYWGTDDESRTEDGESMPLREYLESRVAGRPIWIAPPKDELENVPDGDDYEERKLEREAKYQPMWWGSPV